MPSTLVFVVVVAVAGLITVALSVRLKSVLTNVGRDRAGADPWTQPVGIERTKSGFLLGHLPDCAQAPIERIALWDNNSHPLWEVAGPPTPLNQFVIGTPPKGFTTVHAFEKTSATTMVRVVVVRRLAGVAGGRYIPTDLRIGKVVTLDEKKEHVYTADGFKGLDLCPLPGVKNPDTVPVSSTAAPNP
ncbi:MAG: hypothetical protein JWN46_1230 [Acidimicrobiales bacterium]|nr:hypothetical protein [Acidimicrobiales bacterium]